MFSKPLDRLRRSIGLRLSLWYALVFSASSVVFYLLVTWLFATAVESKEREVIAARLKPVEALRSE